MLVVTVAGPPLVLARLGRPWPTRWPSLSEFGDAMRSTDLPTGPLLKAAALVGWVAWAVVVAGVVVESAARLRGSAHPRRRSPSGPLQPLVAQLVATVMLLAPVVRPTPAAAHPDPTAVIAQPTGTAPAPPLPVDGITAALDAWRSGAADVDLAAVEAAGYRVHVVKRYESVARIAGEQLGDEERWKELWALNRGARQGDGRFTDASLIYRGWRLLLPPSPPIAAPAPGEGANDGRPAVARADSVPADDAPADDAPADTTHADPAPAAADPAPVLRLPSPSTAEGPRKPAFSPAPIPQIRETPPPLPSADGAGRPDRSGTAAPMLGTAGAMLAVGVAAAAARRRRRRQASLPARAMAPPPPASLDGLRAELFENADADHAERFHRALRDVARALADADTDARPRLVQVARGRIEVVLSRPVVPAPPGWRTEASGLAWSLAGEPRDTAADGPAVAPVLVTVGRPDVSTIVHLDLEAEGVVALTGDDDLVGDVARSWVLELATSPMAAGATVVLVGDDLDPPAEDARVRMVTNWAEVAGDACAWLEQSSALLGANRWATPLTGRVGAHNDALAPLVIIGPQPTDHSFEAVRDRILESQVPVVLVVVGSEVEGATIVEVTPAGLGIPALGLFCKAQALSANSALHVDALLEDASHVPAQLTFLPEPARPSAVALVSATDIYRDPPFEVLVRLLGDIEVIGGKRRLKPQETAVAAYIALHGPVAGAQIEDAVWSAPTASRHKRLTNTISTCRSALGPLHLPAADADRRYDTGPGLVTDLKLFEHRLAYAPGQRAGDAVVTLRGALELVRGPVFTARPGERSSFVWVDVENWISTWELQVTEAAEDLATRYLDLGDVDGAVWATRRGLEACKTHGRLTKLLMEAHLANGDAEAARRVFESHQAAMEEFEIEDVASDGLVVAYRKARGEQDAAS